MVEIKVKMNEMKMQQCLEIHFYSYVLPVEIYLGFSPHEHVD